MRSLYLAGPMYGHTLTEAMDWRVELEYRYRKEFKFFIPGIAEGLYKQQSQEVIVTPHADNGINIVKFDKSLVDQSDLLLANLTYAYKASIGTIAEISWMYAVGKPVVVVLGEGIDIIHNHPFITDQAVAVVFTVEEGMKVLKSLGGV